MFEQGEGRCLRGGWEGGRDEVRRERCSGVLIKAGYSRIDIFNMTLNSNFGALLCSPC